MSAARPSSIEAASIFAALGDPTRLALLGQLSRGHPASIASLSTSSRLTRQAVSKHLRVLQEAGFVESRRVGRESRYAYCPETVDAARAYLDGVAEQWDAALDRLRALVEK